MVGIDLGDHQAAAFRTGTEDSEALQRLGERLPLVVMRKVCQGKVCRVNRIDVEVNQYHLGPRFELAQRTPRHLSRLTIEACDREAQHLALCSCQRSSHSCNEKLHPIQLTRARRFFTENGPESPVHSWRG